MFFQTAPAPRAVPEASSQGEGPRALGRVCGVACSCNLFVGTENLEGVLFQLGKLSAPLCGARLLQAIAVIAAGDRCILPMMPAQCRPDAGHVIRVPPRLRLRLDMICQFLEHDCLCLKPSLPPRHVKHLPQSLRSSASRQMGYVNTQRGGNNLLATRKSYSIL